MTRLFVWLLSLSLFISVALSGDPAGQDPPSAQQQKQTLQWIRNLFKSKSTAEKREQVVKVLAASKNQNEKDKLTAVIAAYDRLLAAEADNVPEDIKAAKKEVKKAESAAKKWYKKALKVGAYGVGAVGAVGGLAYGSKKIYDWYKSKQSEQPVVKTEETTGANEEEDESDQPVLTSAVDISDEGSRSWIWIIGVIIGLVAIAGGVYMLLAKLGINLFGDDSNADKTSKSKTKNKTKPKTSKRGSSKGSLALGVPPVSPDAKSSGGSDSSLAGKS